MSITQNLTQINSQLPNLTAIRFFLALFVVLYHLPQYCENRGFPFFNKLPIFFKGDEAVFMFFSLSGFLIIRGLIIEKSKNGFIDLKKFYLRRVLRIFQLYYQILIFGFIFYKIIAPYFGYVDTSNYNLLLGIILGSSFFANILATMKPGGILEILWSIGIEEQFYIFIATVFKFMKIKNFILFLILFTTLYFIIFHLSEFNFLSNYSMYFYFFSFSGIIAYLSLQKITITKYYICFPIYGLFLMLFFSNRIQENLNNTVYNLICMLTFSVTIWMLSQKRISFLNNRILNHLGKISYGIYMYHAVVFQLIGFVFIKFKIPKLISSNNSILLFYDAVISITIIISHFSFKYFENYFIKLKKH